MGLTREKESVTRNLVVRFKNAIKIAVKKNGYVLAFYPGKGYMVYIGQGNNLVFFQMYSHMINFYINGSFADPYEFVKILVTEKRISAVEIVRYQTPLKGSDIRIIHTAKIINLFCHF